jgi:hypothetical protein
MTLRPLPSLAALTLITLPALLPAQTESSSSEEVRLEKLMTDSAQWYVPRSKVSIGFKVLGNGGKVQFGNLGHVDFDLAAAAPFTDGPVNRDYDNGSVHTDAPRLNEQNADGTQASTPGGRYPVFTTVTNNVLDADGNPVLNPDGTNQTVDVTTQTGDFLAYTPGLTRNWTYATASQLTPDGRVAMSTYSASSDGAGFSKEVGATAGVDFQFVYTLSKPASRLQWGVETGISLNGINAKSVGSVTATLHARTDYYSLNGAAAPAAPYNSSQAFVDFLDADGNVVGASGLETTVPLADTPDGPTQVTDTVGGTTINGNWQIKGAYYMLRLGPSVRTQLTSRLNVSASAGLAGAYAGTTYSVAETFQVPDVEGAVVGGAVGTQESTETKFLSGYYADLNLEWLANERTGLFTGFTAQKFGGYDQAVAGRTARIDIGSSVGLRGGISIKF